MFRKLNPDAISRLNDPNQGMSYKGRDHGQRKYDADTGKPYYTPSRPATLTIYGERAETVMAIIEHCETVSAALTTPPTPDRIGKDAVREAAEEARNVLAWIFETSDDHQSAMKAETAWRKLDAALADTKGDRPMGDR